MYYVSESSVEAFWLDTSHLSHNFEKEADYAIRPIVEIDLTKVNVGVTGTGAENDAYSLTLK